MAPNTAGPKNRWRNYYLTIFGPVAITPGDGRWVLHVEGGRVSPWQHGLWFALGQSWINKSHAMLHKANWEAKLANPARALATAPQGATDEQQLSWFQAVMAWGINTVFALKPGYKVELLESNGRGYESFDGTISQSEREYTIAIAGQLVTTDGGAGFSNSDIHRSIRADIIKAVADQHLAHHHQHADHPAIRDLRVGAWMRSCAVRRRSNTTRSRRRIRRIPLEAVAAFGEALAAANAALAPYGKRVDAKEFATQFGIPLEDIPSALASVGDVAGANASANDNDEITIDFEDDDAEPADDVKEGGMKRRAKVSITISVLAMRADCIGLDFDVLEQGEPFEVEGQRGDRRHLWTTHEARGSVWAVGFSAKRSRSASRPLSSLPRKSSSFASTRPAGKRRACSSYPRSSARWRRRPVSGSFPMSKASPRRRPMRSHAPAPRSISRPRRTSGPSA